MIHIQRLGYIGCHAAFRGLFPGVLKDIRGHGDDRNCAGVAAVQGADGAGSIKSVHKGHLDIHQNGTVEARGRSGEHFQRALSIGSDIRRYADPVQHALDDFLIDQVIFGDQYTQALQTGIIRFVCCDVWRGIIHFGTAAGRQRQRDTEGRSDIYRTVYFNGTSHHLGKGVTNGQPQAGPDPVFGRIPVFLGKRRKEAGHEIRMDTAAGIRYGKYGKGDFSRRGRKDGSGQGDDSGTGGNSDPDNPNDPPAEDHKLTGTIYERSYGGSTASAKPSTKSIKVKLGDDSEKTITPDSDGSFTLELQAAEIKDSGEYEWSFAKTDDFLAASGTIKESEEAKIYLRERYVPESSDYKFADSENIVNGVFKGAGVYKVLPTGSDKLSSTQDGEKQDSLMVEVDANGNVEEFFIYKGEDCSKVLTGLKVKLDDGPPAIGTVTTEAGDGDTYVKAHGVYAKEKAELIVNVEIAEMGVGLKKVYLVGKKDGVSGRRTE